MARKTQHSQKYSNNNKKTVVFLKKKKRTVNQLLHLKVHLFNWALYANNTSLLKREGAAATSAYLLNNRVKTKSQVRETVCISGGNSFWLCFSAIQCKAIRTLLLSNYFMMKVFLPREM